MPSPSINPAEVEKFSAMAEAWWDPNGSFRPLHRFNPVRVGYIRDVVASGEWRVASEEKPLKNLTILDIGCGGGLLAEPMARMGAKVTGVDASEKNIGIASAHAKEMELNVEYIHGAAEELAETGRQFDVVLAMEIIEHVADVDSFLAACAKLVKPGGLLFVATLNRTAKSFALAILGAEYILRWMPVGTHDWKKFLKPSEIVTRLESQGLSLHALQGVSYNPLSGAWSLSEDVAVNYMVVAQK